MPQPTNNSRDGVGMSGFLDIAMKILASLVVPLIIWAVKLEVTNALQDERINELQGDLSKLSNITSQVQTINLSLVGLEAKIQNVNEKVANIEDLLRSH